MTERVSAVWAVKTCSRCSVFADPIKKSPVKQRPQNLLKHVHFFNVFSTENTSLSTSIDNHKASCITTSGLRCTLLHLWDTGTLNYSLIIYLCIYTVLLKFVIFVQYILQGVCPWKDCLCGLLQHLFTILQDQRLFVFDTVQTAAKQFTKKWLV